MSEGNLFHEAIVELEEARNRAKRLRSWAPEETQRQIQLLVYRLKLIDVVDPGSSGQRNEWAVSIKNLAGAIASLDIEETESSVNTIYELTQRLLAEIQVYSDLTIERSIPTLFERSQQCQNHLLWHRQPIANREGLKDIGILLDTHLGNWQEELDKVVSHHQELPDLAVAVDDLRAMVQRFSGRPELSLASSRVLSQIINTSHIINDDFTMRSTRTDGSLTPIDPHHLLSQIVDLRDFTIQAYAEGFANQMADRNDIFLEISSAVGATASNAENVAEILREMRELEHRARGDRQAMEYQDLALKGNRTFLAMLIASVVIFAVGFAIANPRLVDSKFLFAGHLLWLTLALFFAGGVLLKAAMMERHNAIVYQHKERAMRSYSYLVGSNPETVQVLLPFLAAAVFSHQPTGYSKGSDGGDASIEAALALVRKQ